MVSRLKYSFTISLLILSTFIFVGCQDNIPYRSTIAPDQAQTSGGSTGGDGGGIEERPSNAILFRTDFCACKG